MIKWIGNHYELNDHHKRKTIFKSPKTKQQNISSNCFFVMCLKYPYRINLLILMLNCED